MKTRKEEIREYHAELKLGDKLEWLFRKTGIKWLVKLINPNCKCLERQKALNDIEFRINRK